MDSKISEIFIPGPAGRLEAKYFKSKKSTSPIALVLQPHPQYGGTMNNKVVVETFHAFMENDFSVCRVNFRGVGKSDGEFDNGPEEGIRAIVTIIKSKTFHPLLKKLNLYTNNFIINSTTKIDKAILSI